jgi:GNAT superfamily N-acetyltransferase
MTTIRRGERRDLPMIVAGLREFYAELNQQVPPVPTVERGVRHVLASDRSWYWVAELDGQPIALQRAEVWWDDIMALDKWHLQRLYVFPAYRGRGIAKELLLNAQREATIAGNVWRLTCHIHSWNERCLQLHRNLGWIVDGHILIKKPSLDLVPALQTVGMFLDIEETHPV